MIVVGLFDDWRIGLVSLYKIINYDNTPPEVALKVYSKTILPTGILFASKMYKNPIGKRLLDEKSCLLEAKLTNFDYLKSLPEETLGKEYYNFWSANLQKNSSLDYQKIRKDHAKTTNIRFNFGPVTEYERVMRFFDQMAYQHDLMHTLLGYKITMLGEIGVHGVLYNHLKIPAVKLIFWSGMIAEAIKTKSLIPIKVGIESRKIGKKINTNLFMVDWVEHLDVPIKEIKKKFNILENKYYIQKEEKCNHSKSSS